MPRATPARADLIEALDHALATIGTQSVLLSQLVAHRLGLNRTDVEVLALLHRLGPRTAGQLATQIGLTTSAMTQALDRLERAGFANRTRDASDRRLVVIQPASDVMAQELAPLEHLLGQACAAYSEDQLSLLLGLLVQINAATRTHIDGLRAGNTRIDQPASGLTTPQEL